MQPLSLIDSSENVSVSLYFFVESGEENMMGPATANQCTSLLSSGEMKVKVHHDVHAWIHVSYVFVVVFLHFIPRTYLIRMSCISKMSPMTVVDVPGLSHLYLLAKTVGRDDDADALTVQINK